jgi:hypothetical protein
MAPALPVRRRRRRSCRSVSGVRDGRDVIGCRWVGRRFGRRSRVQPVRVVGVHLHSISSGLIPFFILLLWGKDSLKELWA